MKNAQTEVTGLSRTLWLLVTISRGWPWENKDLIEECLGKHVARARDNGFDRFVLVHGAYGVFPDGGYKYDPPRSDGIARSIWVDGWGFAEDPHPADFVKYGRAAGPLRNSEMVSAIVDRVGSNPGDLARCEAFIVADSRGASGTADLAERAGIITKRHNLGKVYGPARKRSGPVMVTVPGTGRVVPVKPRRPVDLKDHVPPPIPGPCGRCGQVSYLMTDNVLFHGDGVCVYWDAVVGRWIQGCGRGVPLARPRKGVAGPDEVGSPGPVRVAQPGRGADRARRAS